MGKTGYTPLPFKTTLSSIKSSSKNHKSTKSKPKPAKQTPLHSKNVISSIIAEKAKLSQEVKLDKQNKMKPKLKAEAKVKTWEDDESSSVTENMPESTVEELTYLFQSLIRYINIYIKKNIISLFSKYIYFQTIQFFFL